MGNIILNIADIFLDINKLKQISKILKTSPRKLFEDFVKQPENFAKKLGSMTSAKRKAFAEALGKAQKKTAETQSLSSSWIRKGSWTPTGSGESGDLTIWTKKGKVGYTYPGVGFRTWEAMKKAKGQNGGGAGSVFWTMYLHGFKKSTYGQFIKKLQKLTGIKGIKM